MTAVLLRKRLRYDERDLIDSVSGLDLSARRVRTNRPRAASLAAINVDLVPLAVPVRYATERDWKDGGTDLKRDLIHFESRSVATMTAPSGTLIPLAVPLGSHGADGLSAYMARLPSGFRKTVRLTPDPACQVR